ncbi:MAG TPA: zf-HC2 domain-containing protein [Magnetospirillum sp.]|nr:zf-HC2 domain-containing protein [Magnetospirillum sp.]
MSIHPVTETDLLAFVDDRLSDGRRAEIEAHLISCPADAHRVAADIALLEGLRLIFGRPLRSLYTSFLA